MSHVSGLFSVLTVVSELLRSGSQLRAQSLGFNAL